ncbi:MAG: ABC transporter ATP-binding protein [Xanthomonadaceae bacterium]|nr:ABC transporter ATP-binding protein [Xanthomonadaceae bacterium]
MLADPCRLAAGRAALLLNIDALEFAFTGRRVLTGLSLSVGRGEIVALLGPNGSGKSTLIRAICGRLRPDAGSVSVSGVDPHADPQARRLIGLVPQQIALYPHLSVLENVRAFGRLSGVASNRIGECAEYALETCDLQAVAARRAGQLSGGWQRRTNIACALSHSPELLILDEPTVGIDPPARRDIESLLGRLAGHDIGILMTSHDLGQLERLADRVAFLKDGVVAASGKPADLIAKYYAGQREWDVMLLQAPSTRQAGLLGQIGLVADPADGNWRWRGLVDEQTPAAEIERVLDGLPVSQWRVRRPGLGSLWRTLYPPVPETRR